jgi:hypothetical protein
MGVAVMPSMLRADPAATKAVSGAASPALASSITVPIPAAPQSAPMVPGLPMKPELRPLLDRARAALDAHPDHLVLRDRIALADFNVASSEHRLHVVDLVAGQSISYLVAHGRGSDPDHSGYLQSFSNEPNSLATSEGAYLTGDVYTGVHGTSMRLVGLDATNNNADMRAIVVHGADYVSEDHIAQWGKLGRSEGCFVIAPHLVTQFLDVLGPGRLIYAAKIA